MIHKRNPKANVKGQCLSAHDVYQLTVETLQTYFPLERAGCDYQAPAIWDVVISAAVERTTVETVCDVLTDSPSANTVRNAIKGLLPADENLDQVETTLNELLLAQLPKNLLRKSLRCAVDVVLIPYHGKHEATDEAIRRGAAKSGTTHFHAYATWHTITHNKRYTLAVTFVHRADTAVEILTRLHQRATTLGVRVKRLLLDREFDNNGVIGYLRTQPFPSIIPLIIRGKNGGTRALVKGRRKSYQTTYTRKSTVYATETFTVHVACKYSKGRYKRQGIYRFAYIVLGTLKMHPLQVYTEYRFRFGIETSYRLMNQVRARTTSKSAALRFFYIGIAFLLLNLWNFVKWTYCYLPQCGPRQVCHQLLSLARWRLWLWEVIKQRWGLQLEIALPTRT